MLPRGSEKVENPEAQANVFSKMFFFWLIPLIKQSFSKGLKEEDMSDIRYDDKSEYLGNQLEFFWENEKLNSAFSHRKPSLRKALMRNFKKPYILCALMSVAQGGCGFGALIMMACIIHLNEDDNKKDQLLWLLGTTVSLFCFVTLNAHNNMLLKKTAVRCRISCASLAFRKFMKLSVRSLRLVSEHEIHYILKNNNVNLERSLQHTQNIWVLPVDYVVLLVFMCYEFGPISIFGILAVTCYGVLLTAGLYVAIIHFENTLVRYTKSRLVLMGEFLDNIKGIKMLGCEQFYKDASEYIRRKELRYLCPILNLRGFVSDIHYLSTRFAILCTFLAINLTKTIYSTDLLYLLFMCFTMLQVYIASRIGVVIKHVVRGRHALHRLEKFLMLEEKSYILKEKDILSKKKTGSIKLTGVYASWHVEDSVYYTLNDINLDIVPGSLNCVIGEESCGKTSLLQAILQEIPIYKGTVHKVGSIVYTPTEPWLFNATIRDNILFGQDFYKIHYTTILNVCGLTTELEKIIGGDQSEYNKNMKITVGLKQMINLARALYRDTDIYLLDEPFLGISEDLCVTLFEKCLVNHLSGKTRIIATKHESFLKYADSIIVLKEGHVVHCSSYADLPRDLTRLIPPFVVTKFEMDVDESLLNAFSHISNTLTLRGHMNDRALIEYCALYRRVWVVCLRMVLYFVPQIMLTLTDLYVLHLIYTTQTCTQSFVSSFLMNLFQVDQTCNVGLVSRSRVLFYGILLLVTLVSWTMRCWTFFAGRIRTSRMIFADAINNIIYSPFAFFRDNHSESIIDRFSRDLHAIDVDIPMFLMVFFTGLHSLICFILFAGLLFPATILMGISAILVVLYSRKCYLNMAEDLIVIVDKEQAKMDMYISEIYEGMISIRCYNAEYMVTKDFDSLQDNHTYPYHIIMMSYKMLGLYLDFFGLLYIAVVTLHACFIPNYRKPSSCTSRVHVDTSVALGMVYIGNLYLLTTLSYSVKLSVCANIQMYNVQRFLHNVHQEPERLSSALVGESMVNNEKWPTDGEVIFSNVYVIHSSLVGEDLFDFSATIEPRQRVAIVGTDNSGKWSLPEAILSLQKKIGSIFIDSIDTTKIPFDVLRKAIGTFPRNPLVAPTSIRNNLTLYKKLPDNVLWRIVKELGLDEVVKSLDEEATLEPDPYSYVQKQMFSVARLLVANCKIVIIEDFEYSMAAEKEDFIWNKLLLGLKNSTLIAITERRSVVARFDRVIVLKSGKIVEEGVAAELLENDEALLHSALSSDDILQPNSKYVYRERTKI